MTYLIHYIQTILTWLLTFVDWVLIEVFSVICAAVGAVLNAIPVPSWASSAGSSLSALPAGVLYFAQAADLPTGLSIIFSAWGIRFLIRRIPFIG
jgi:hypothetical protein